MVLLGVLFTVAICLVIDRLLNRGLTEARQISSQADVAVASRLATTASADPVTSPVVRVAGFRLQPDAAYHPGHGWAQIESEEVVRVGADDFALQLSGPVDDLHLPEEGAWVVQGATGWVLCCGDRRAPMLAPCSGRVIQVNRRVIDDPAVLRSDPFGAGWLLRLRTSAVRPQMNNLLNGAIVERWLDDAAARLRLRLTGSRVISYADGGKAGTALHCIDLTDPSGRLPPRPWRKLLREFLLTGPTDRV